MTNYWDINVKLNLYYAILGQIPSSAVSPVIFLPSNILQNDLHTLHLFTVKMERVYLHLHEDFPTYYGRNVKISVSLLLIKIFWVLPLKKQWIIYILCRQYLHGNKKHFCIFQYGQRKFITWEALILLCVLRQLWWYVNLKVFYWELLFFLKKMLYSQKYFFSNI